MFSRSLIVLAVVGFCCGATWQGYHPMKPKDLAHKQGCYVQEINDVVPFGTELTPIGYCYRINCGREMLYYASCGVAGTEDASCYVTEEDTRLMYPECCPTVKCEQDNRI